MIFKKIKLNALAIAQISVLAISGIIIVLVGLFLYRDFYKTIVYAKDVIILKQDVLMEDIDMEKFKTILKVHSYKTSYSLGQKIFDPFKTEKPAIETTEENSNTSAMAE